MIPFLKIPVSSARRMYFAPRIKRIKLIELLGIYIEAFIATIMEHEFPVRDSKKKGE